MSAKIGEVDTVVTDPHLPARSQDSPLIGKDGAIYTCPMHPQIRHVGPGNCPICGMTLEPLIVRAEEAPSEELADMSRRFWIGLGFTLPIFLLEMGVHIPTLRLHELAPASVSIWVQFALSTPVVLWAGWPFFQRAWASLVSRHLNMFTLIALGTGAAYVYSVVATFAPQIFPDGFRGMDGTVAVYYEAAAVITVLVLLGQVLELRAREQTGGAIRALLKLAPKTALRVRVGAEDEIVPLEQVYVGDKLRVRPGEGVPVDGEVLEGESAVDESMVTGESMPAAKAPKDKLIGGTVNGTGSLVMLAIDDVKDRVWLRLGVAVDQKRACCERWHFNDLNAFLHACAGFPVDRYGRASLEQKFRRVRNVNKDVPPHRRFIGAIVNVCRFGLQFAARLYARRASRSGEKHTRRQRRRCDWLHEEGEQEDGVHDDPKQTVHRLTRRVRDSFFELIAARNRVA